MNSLKRAFLLLACLFSLAFANAPAQAQPTEPTLPAAQTNLLQDITAVSAGGEHACALTAAGGVKCWGSNEYDQLGDGTTIRRSVPVDVPGFISGVTAISAGESFTCALTGAGAVWCWGEIIATPSRAPKLMTGLESGAKAITAGRYHACAITAADGLKCWGFNTVGQLGIGPGDPWPDGPQDVTSLPGKVKQVSAGYEHTCALLFTGDVYCWGGNFYGELGSGPGSEKYYPVKATRIRGTVTRVIAGLNSTFIFNASGGLSQFGWINQSADPVPVFDSTVHVDQVSMHGFHACALAGGSVSCWGSNEYGQVGSSPNLYGSEMNLVSGLAGPATAVAAGRSFSCAVVAGTNGPAGRVQCWGRDNASQLGRGVSTQRTLPMAVNGIATGLQALAAGRNFTCALDAAGQVTCWGEDNPANPPGLRDTAALPRAVTRLAQPARAITAGKYHACVLNQSNGVTCFGAGVFGVLGTADPYGAQPLEGPYEDVAGLSSGVRLVSAGYLHNCALTFSGKVKCWGYNRSGQLGDGSKTDRLTPVEVTGLTGEIVAISAGDEHTCALNSAGGVQCWGKNFANALGQSDNSLDYSAVPLQVHGLESGVAQIASAGYHTCAVMTSGGVSCWGLNNFGQIGDGQGWSQDVILQVSGLAGKAVALAAGFHHSCALLESGQLQCWGASRDGQLGDGTVSDTPRAAMTPAGLAGGVLSVTAGDDHVCALVTGGRALCWGDDSLGQLGPGQPGPGQPGSGCPRSSVAPVDVVGSIDARIRVNYASGQPGSIFTVTGHNFPPGALLNLLVNGHMLPGGITTNPTGGFLLFLDTSQAGPGSFTLSTNGSGASLPGWFYLTAGSSLRPMEGGGPALALPAGLAAPLTFLFLPQVGK